MRGGSRKSLSFSCLMLSFTDPGMTAPVFKPGQDPSAVLEPQKYGPARIRAPGTPLPPCWYLKPTPPLVRTYLPHFRRRLPEFSGNLGHRIVKRSRLTNL